MERVFIEIQGDVFWIKKTKTRTTPRYGKETFKWGEQLKFDIKDIETQGIEFHLWEKRITPNYPLGGFQIFIKELIESASVEINSDLTIDLEDGKGQIIMEFYYRPNVDELKRIQSEKEKRIYSNSRTSTADFDFLMS